MKKIALTTLITLLCVPFMYSQEMSKAEYVKELKSQFAEIEKTQITYQVFETFNKPLSEERRKELQKEVDFFQSLLEKRKNNELSEKELHKWRNVSNEELQKIVDQRNQRLEDQSVEAIYIYTTDGVKIRKDIIRPEGNPVQHCYIFDGYNGYMITPGDGKVRTGSNFAERWLLCRDFPRFGSGLELFLGDILQISGRETKKDNNETMTLTVSVDSRNNADSLLKFTMVDDNPFYWNQCDLVRNDRIHQRTVCRNFKNHNGLWLPNEVIIQEPRSGDFRDKAKLSLMDVKINEEVSLEKGFFDVNSLEKTTVLRFDRE